MVIPSSRLDLSRIKARTTRSIPKAVLERATMGMRETFEDALIYDLSTWIHGLEGERIDIDETWPSTWIDAIKDRWYPNWLKRWTQNEVGRGRLRWRMRISYKRVAICQQLYKAVCPHIREPEHVDDRECLHWLASREADRANAEF